MTTDNRVPMSTVHLRVPKELKKRFKNDCTDREVTMRDRLIELIADSLPAKYRVEDPDDFLHSDA